MPMGLPRLGVQQAAASGWAAGWGAADGAQQAEGEVGLAGFLEHRDVAQGVEVLPGDALRVGDPVLLAAGVAAGGLALVQQGHVGRLGAGLHLGQFGRVVRLDAQVVDAGLAAAGGDGEVHRRVLQHPLGVVGFHAGGFGGEQLGIEADALAQVIDMQVDVKALHGRSFSSRRRSRTGARPWRDIARLPLAAMRGEVGQQIVHLRQVGLVEEVAAFAVHVHQAGMHQALEVKRQRGGGQIQQGGQGAGRHARRAGAHQGAEHAQPGFLGQGRQRGNSGFLFHVSIIMELLE
jgi:hypothetical protein